jgi:hypothetical protein
MSTIATDKDFGEGVSELSARSENGLDVALLWRQSDNTATVVVVDHRTRASFAVDVHESDSALDIFHHPYAYAAQRRINQAWPADRQDIRVAA